MKLTLDEELIRLVSDQAKLAEQVISAELELETAKTETAQFQRRYYEMVGRFYAQLDELDAQIANAQAGLSPDDAAAQDHAQAAQEQARKSAEEAGLIEAQPLPPPVITPQLKQAFRRAAMMMHPDRATTEPERLRRHGLMIKLNLAYERGDQQAIEKLVLEFIQDPGMREVEDPELIADQGVELRVLQTVRRTGQLRRRMDEIQEELQEKKQSDIYKLKITIERAELRGGDPLGDLAEQLLQELAERRIRLEEIA
ncbi:MAG: J domain-containing protein [Betaproteobacteria bacterium]|nr:J domain-containing protein [Betaproteobacteria bacterium]